MSSELEARVQRIEDRWAINDLLVNYSTTTDDHDIGGLAELYTEDAVFQGVAGQIDGRAGIADYYEQRLASFGASYHIPYTHKVDFVSDTEARGLTLGATEVSLEGQAFWVAMRYYDHYIKGADGNWRFRERRIEQIYAMPLADLPAGMASDLRKRWPGTEPAAADLPEGSTAWQAHQSRLGL
ncbi:MAG: ketosteroid isomerase-like protein [Ilumatobacter sp.]|jgi:ketosteroid isomerase-like protein